MNLGGIAYGSILSVKYEVIKPMTTFNLLAHIIYLSRLFGNWTSDIVPPLENMVAKVIYYNDNAMNALNTHVNKELAFQFYHGSTKVYFNSIANGDIDGDWIQLLPETYQRETADFLSAQLRLIRIIILVLLLISIKNHWSYHLLRTFMKELVVNLAVGIGL
jgi:hypothetical protein